MNTMNEDYILRQIERMSDLVALALGFKATGKHDEALRTVDSALEELLGTESELLLLVDPQTAARLIGDPRKIKAYADLLKTKVELGPDNTKNTMLVSRYETLYEEVARLRN